MSAILHQDWVGWGSRFQFRSQTGMLSEIQYHKNMQNILSEIKII